MPVKALYCKEDELKLAIAAMRELASVRTGYAANIDAGVRGSNGENLREMAYNAAGKLLDTANTLEHDLSWSHESLTADEEKTELRKIIDDLFESVGHRVHGTLAEQLAAGVRTVKGQRQEAFGVAASIITELNTKLEAMRWIIQSALVQPTHGTKNSRLNLALEAITEITNELQGIDTDSLDRFTTFDWHKGSFNVRKLNAKIQHQESQIRRLREQLEQREVALQDVLTATE